MFYVVLALTVVTAFAVAYVFLIRPFLHSVPKLKAFFDEADTFWGKVWALVYRSATVAWSYAMLVFGTLFNQLDTIAGALGDPDLKTQVSNFFSADPKVLGWFLMGAAVVTLAARLRSIAKSA
ncbi:hypothetical protein [Bradyrhizobium sp. SZCCHNS2005]|uniref:hypothetical protein n=1 Tax=Bradyrhizobium sp. SZCCHNS2005 TaxID=3057303 RepID=UPI0028E2288A|nr:hypothetical protein [Bradyrhizobium sp. SZCCHNS2005]